MVILQRGQIFSGGASTAIKLSCAAVGGNVLIQVKGERAAAL